MRKAFLLFCLLCLIFPEAFSQKKLETIVQTGHSQAVLAVSSDSSGKYIVSAGKDKTIKLWDRETGLELRTYYGHEKSVTSVDISPDLNYLLSSSVDGTAILWDIISGKVLFQTPQNTEILTAAKFIGTSFFITGGLNKEANVWDIEKKDTIASIEVNPDKGSGFGISISISPDQKLLAIGEDNKSVQIIDTESWENIGKISPLKGSYWGFGTLTDFSDDGEKLLVVSRDATPYLYSIKDKSTTEIDVEVKDPTGAWFEGSENIIIAEEEKAYNINLKTGQIVNSFSFKAKANRAVSSGKGSIAVGLDNNTVDLISWNTGKTLISYKGILNEAEQTGIEYDPNSYWEAHIAKYLRLKNPILFNPDSKGYLKGKSGLKVRSWDIYSGKPEAEFTGHEKAIVAMKINRTGKLLATGGADGQIRVWDLKDRKNILTIQGHRAAIFSVDFNPVYEQIVSTSWDGTVKVWDLNSGEMLSIIDLDNKSAYDAAFTRDGLYIVIADFEKKLQMWEPDSKSIVREFAGHTDVVSSIDFSDDGKYMLSGSWDGSIRLWDIQTGLMMKKILESRNSIHVAKFSIDEKFIISAGDDRVINIYETETANLLNSLNGHKAEITNLDQSPDGNYLLSYSLDGVIKLWDYKELYSVFDHIHVGATDWMVKNNEGYFNGTDGAIRKVHFVNGLQAYSADQFYEKFYRPDLLKKSAHGKKRSGSIQKIQNYLLESPLPSVKIAAYPENKDHQAIIMVKIKDEGGGVSDFKIWHNGKRIALKPFKLPEASNEEVIYTDTLKMVGGKNVFSASAQNREKVETYKVHAELFSENREKSSTCHIMLVGLNKYKNPALNLGFAKADAESFGIKMQDKGEGLYKKIVVHSLYDDLAKRTNILDTLDKLAQEIHLHDVFVFFYAGHGSYQNDQFYLIPNECTRAYDDQMLEKSGISADLLQKKFQEIKALKQIVIMDACHSGGSVEVLASRGSMEEKAIAQLARSAGVHILASSGEEQVSKEVKELEHGIFTYVLLQGLSGAADGSPADGKITVYELKSYIDDQVPMLNEKYSGKAQYPYTFSRGQDFPVCLE